MKPISGKRMDRLVEQAGWQLARIKVSSSEVWALVTRALVTNKTVE